MYLLSTLIENYLAYPELFSNRSNFMYLSGLIDELNERGADCPAMRSFSVKDDVSFTGEAFLNIVRQLYGTIPDEDLLFKVAVDEYKSGSYGSACEFVYYRNIISKRLKLPLEIRYSPVADEYFSDGMSSEETEEVIAEILAKNGIINENDKNK